MTSSMETRGRWKSPVRTWKNIRANVQRLRREMTPAERHLWAQLRKRGVAGLKFRRQHPVARFALDFYCPEARLAIEVDGDIHKYQTQDDAARQQFLESTGIRMLRFTNEEVLKDVAGVVRRIQLDVTQSSPGIHPVKRPSYPR